MQLDSKSDFATNVLVLEFFVGICLVSLSYLHELKTARTAQLHFSFDDIKSSIISLRWYSGLFSNGAHTVWPYDFLMRIDEPFHCSATLVPMSGRLPVLFSCEYWWISVTVAIPSKAGNFTCGETHVKRRHTQFNCVRCSLPVETGEFIFYAGKTSRRIHAIAHYKGRRSRVTSLAGCRLTYLQFFRLLYLRCSSRIPEFASIFVCS